MRKFILIAAMVLTSATAQAESRSLSLASGVEPVAAEQPKAIEVPKAVKQKSAEAPAYVARLAAVETRSEIAKVEPSNAEPSKPVAEKTASAPTAVKPKHRRYGTEARIIGELHRHGIYW
jgi:hypothetical protein